MTAIRRLNTGAHFDLAPQQVCRADTKPLTIFKFGGTSVGQASCIERVADIIKAASGASRVVVVVSAMAGVTNRLLEATSLSERGEVDQALAIFAELRDRHLIALSESIHSSEERDCIAERLDSVLREGSRLCAAAAAEHFVTPATRDVLAGLGERLSIPIVAAVLRQRGVTSQAMVTDGLIVTDGYHGSADPQMELTRQRCQAVLPELLARGIVPVLTGFIGATQDGVSTTLGRGGSDYSATILGAALDADEVVIWTDVDGMLTADPRLVSGTCTVSEISYREAAELAYYGAKVLHPKTLRPVMQSGIPLWIRNTFVPDQPGTKITPSGPHKNEDGVKALAAFQGASLVSITAMNVAGTDDLRRKILTAAAAVRADLLLISEGPIAGDILLAVPAESSARTIEELEGRFSSESKAGNRCVSVRGTAAIVTIVGQSISRTPEIAELALEAMRRADLNVIAAAQSSSECSFSFAVPPSQLSAALDAIHREFRLGVSQTLGDGSCSALDFQASAAD